MLWRWEASTKFTVSDHHEACADVGDGRKACNRVSQAAYPTLPGSRCSVGGCSRRSRHSWRINDVLKTFQTNIIDELFIFHYLINIGNHNSFCA
jgi:hypothetical protein